MPLSDRLRPLLARAPAVVTRALAGASVLTLLYVGYSHVASIRGRDYALASYSETLDSERALARFTVVDGAGLQHQLTGGALHIVGTAEAGTATWVVGPAQYLDDVVVASVRYLATAAADADVVVGLERAEDPVGGKESRRLLFSTHGEGANAPFAIEGDKGALDAREMTATTSAVPAGFKPTLEDETVHLAELRLSAWLDRAVGSVGNTAVVSAKTRWPMGTRVRLVFGVIARRSGAKIDVGFLKAAYEQQERPLSVTPFHERFRAKFIDPRRWSVLLGDGDNAEVGYELDATGLRIRARSKGHDGFQTAFELMTPPTPLRSFTYETEWEVRKLKGAAIVFGLGGAGYSIPRFGDFGFRESNGVLTAIAVGNIDGTGQVGFHGTTVKQTSDRITVRYDASTGRIKATLGLFNTIAEGKFDLFPGESVQLRVVVNLDNADSEVDASLREAAYD